MKNQNDNVPNYSAFFKNGPTPASFSFIFVFSYNNRHLVASGIQTWIFGAVGKSTDHYTTTTAQAIELESYQ